MKFAHIENGNLLGWYDDEIHSVIPDLSVQVSDQDWQEAININANFYEGGLFARKDEPLNQKQIDDMRIEFARERATELAQRYAVDQMIDDLSDGEVETLTFLYPAWVESISLAVNDKVRHNGILYRVLQAHTTQADWTPDTAASLFTRFRDPVDEPQPWVQPQGDHDAYQVGEQVTHNGQTWTSTVADNVWEPGVHGWVVA